MVNLNRAKDQAVEMYNILKSIESLHGVFGILGDSPSSKALAKRVSEVLKRIDAEPHPNTLAGTLIAGRGQVTMGDEAAAMPPFDRYDGLSPADLAQIELLGGEG